MRHKVPELELSEILLLKKIKIFNYMKDAGSEREVTTAICLENIHN